MKRIKYFLIGIFFSILLIPMITNNVYAEEVLLYSHSHNGSSYSTQWDDRESQAYSTSNSVVVDLTDISKIKIVTSCTGYSGFNASVSLSIPGITSKSYGVGSNSNEIDVSSYSGNYTFASTITVHKGEYSWNEGSITIYGIKQEKPRFQGTLSSGNLTHFKISAF